MNNGPKLYIVALLVASTLITTSFAWMSIQNTRMTGRGLSISVNLVGFDDKAVDIYAQVEALPPVDWGLNDILLFRGRLEKPLITIPLDGDFARVVNGYIQYYEKLVKSGLRPEFARKRTELVRLSLWVVNRTSGDILCRIVDYISYSPYEVVERVISTEINVYRVFCEKLSKVLEKASIPRALADHTPSPLQPWVSSVLDSIVVHANGVCEWTPFWETVYIISPENITEVPGSSNFITYINGVPYLKTPIYIFNNSHALSSVLDTYIAIGGLARSGTYYTIGMGSGLIAKATEDILGVDDIVLYKSSNAKLYMVEGGWDFPYHYPINASFYYIYMRPVIRIAREVICRCCGLYCYNCYYTGNEYVVQEVRDIATVGNVYYGGHEWVTRDHWLVNVSRLYFNVTFTNLTYFGRLDQNRSYFYFIDVYGWFDVCEASWEISVHPGMIIVAIAMAFKVTIPKGLLVLAAIPTISFGYEDGVVTSVLGQVLIAEYRYVEFIYFRFNRYWYYRYRAGQICQYPVPILFYIESY